ncbi:MAG: 50S ribosomal protein L29 [Chloroflexota bacterium]
MPGIDIRDVRKMTDDQLLDAVEDKREELFNLRFQQASGQLEDVNLLRYAKRDMARLLTVQRERELAAELAEEEQRNA